MATPKTNINREMLKWARQAAGYSLAEAARRAAVARTKVKTSEERLDDWENGRDYPTMNQLKKIAKAYYRPLALFYLQDPTKPDSDVVDFRTVADEEVGKPTPALRALVAKMKARQKEVLEILNEREPHPRPLPFVGRFEDNWDIGAVAKDIESVLQLPFSRRQNISNNDALLRLIRNSAEDAGIYVLAQGDLGSYHTDIQPSVFRGFALADPVAPFVVVNDNDAKPAQIFTVVHEMAHLWIGETGVSNYNPFGQSDQGNIERFCNNVAAEFLMPKGEISRGWEAFRDLELESTVQVLAKEFSVSRAAIANRLWKLNKIPGESWWELYEIYKKEWASNKAKQRESDDSPPLYYPMKKAALGRKLVQVVLGAVDTGEVTYTRASRILDVAPENFEKLRA